MAENPDRFVIIDGVQVSRERAKRKGLLDADGKPHQTGPTESRARTEQSARRPVSGATHVAAAPAPAAPVVTAQVGDGAVSVGEDAQRAGAPDPGTPASVDTSTPAGAPVVPAAADGSDAGAADSAADAAAAATGDGSAAGDDGSAAGDDGSGGDGGGDSSAAAKSTPAPKIRRR